MHEASWAFAYAHAGGCHGGVGHPTHRATRAHTDRLRARVAAARRALTIQPDQEIVTS